jgi:diacylglycerol kinase (ATP)
MQKIALLYNPLSGRRRGRRLAHVEQVAGILRTAGLETRVVSTLGSSATPDQVHQQIADGCDTIFACGGDGTIHDVLQGMVGSNVALGVIPLGTANSLAHDLGLPMSASGAAKALLGAAPKRIAIGHINCLGFNGEPVSRYFVVTAGIGVDAHVFYKLSAPAKLRFGLAGYYLTAFQLWLTHPMHLFRAITKGSDGESREHVVSQLLAVRIRNFGGILRELAPGASLDRNDFRMVLFHNRSRASYLGHIVRGICGSRWNVPGVERLHADSALCSILDGKGSEQVLVEADGELLGSLPAEVTIVPDALTLLVPQESGQQLR